jgi:hypothetical protein
MGLLLFNFNFIMFKAEFRYFFTPPLLPLSVDVGDETQVVEVIPLGLDD